MTKRSIDSFVARVNDTRVHPGTAAIHARPGSARVLTHPGYEADGWHPERRWSDYMLVWAMRMRRNE